MAPAREPRIDNTRQGKESLRFPVPHNRHPGGAHDMRTLRWRAWRREASAWLRTILKERS